MNKTLTNFFRVKVASSQRDLWNRSCICIFTLVTVALSVSHAEVIIPDVGVIESADSVSAIRVDRQGVIHSRAGGAQRQKTFVITSDAQRKFTASDKTITEAAIGHGYPTGSYTIPGEGVIKAMVEHPGGDRLLVVVEDTSLVPASLSSSLESGLKLSNDAYAKQDDRPVSIISLNISAEVENTANGKVDRSFSELTVLQGAAYNVTDMAVSPQGDYALITAMGVSESRATPFGVIPGSDELTGGVFVVDLDTLETVSFLPTALKGEDTRAIRQALVSQGVSIKHPLVQIAKLNEQSSALKLSVGFGVGSQVSGLSSTLALEYLNNHFIASMLSESYKDFGFLAAYSNTYPHDMIGATGVDISNRGDIAMVTMERTNNVGVIPISTFVSPLGDISFETSQIGFESASPKVINAENIDFSLSGSGVASNSRFSYWGPADIAFSPDDSAALIGAYGGRHGYYGLIDLDDDRDLVLSADPSRSFIQLTGAGITYPKHVAAMPAIDNDGDGLSNHAEAFNRWNDGRELSIGDVESLAGFAGSGLADINIPVKTRVNGEGGETVFYLLPHSGVGYRLDYLGNAKFSINAGNADTITGIEKIGWKWADTNPPRPYFIVQAMAHAGGGNLYNKSGEIQDYSSRLGFDANVSYFSSDSDEPFDVVSSNGPSSPRDNKQSSLSGLDQGATRKLIDILLAESMVKEVWIDPLVHAWYDQKNDKFVVRGELSPSSQKRRDCDSFMKVVFGATDSVQILVDNTSKVYTDAGVIYYQDNSLDLDNDEGVPITFLISDQHAESFTFGASDQLYYDKEKTLLVNTSEIFEADWLRESPVLYVDRANPTVSITTYDADEIQLDLITLSTRSISVSLSEDPIPQKLGSDGDYKFPGWADGFNLDKASIEDISGDRIDDAADDSGDTITHTINAAFTGLDVNAYIRISYSASPPAGVSRYTKYSGSPRLPIYDTFFKLPDSGLLRVWKSSGPSRNFTDYVAPGIHKLSDLSDQHASLTLYFETVASGSDYSGCLIQISVDPDGPGPAGFIATDSVLVGSSELLISDVEKIEVGQTATLTPTITADSYKLHYDPRFLEVKSGDTVLEPGFLSTLGELSVTALQETYVPGSSIVAVEFITQVKEIGVVELDRGDGYTVNEVKIEPGSTRIGRVDLSGVWTGPGIRWEHDGDSYENPISVGKKGEEHRLRFDETHLRAIIAENPEEEVVYEFLKWVPEYASDEKNGPEFLVDDETNVAIIKASTAAGYVLVKAHNQDGTLSTTTLRVDIGCVTCREDCDDEVTIVPNSNPEGVSVGVSDGSGGKASIRTEGAPTPAISTPAGIDYPYENYNEANPQIAIRRLGVVRQILTASHLIDVDVIDEYSYTMVSHPIVEAPAKSGGLYSIKGLIAETTITVSNPDRDEANNVLEVTEMSRGEMVSFTRFEYDAETNMWNEFSTLDVEGFPLATGVSIERTVDDSGSEIKNHKTTTNYNSDGSVALTMSQTETEFPFGGRTTEEVIDPDGANLITTTTYHDDISKQGAYGQIELIEGYDGFWIKYEYDDEGRVIKEVTPWLNSDHTSSDNNNTVITWTYLGDTTKPRSKIVKKLGLELERTYWSYYADAVVETAATQPGAAESDPSGISVRKEFYTSGYFKGENKRIELPNGVVTLYEYGKSGSNIFITQATGEPNSTGDQIIRGTEVKSITDKDGEELSRLVYDIESGTLVDSQIATELDSSGRARRVEYLDGTFIERSYGCCGLEYEVDKVGVRTDYGYDHKKRLIAETRLGVTTHYFYDGSGKRIRTQIEDSNNEKLIVRQNYYNSRAGLSYTYDLGGRRTSYSTTYPAWGGSVDTVDLPSEGKIITTSAADGRVVSVSGDASLPNRFEYGVETVAGQVFEFKKTIFIAEGDAEDSWIKEYYDMLGRMVRKEFADGSDATWEYNSDAQLVKSVDADGVTELYAYDSEGERTVTAIDMDRDGVVDYEGTDRVTAVEKSVLYSAEREAEVTRSVINVWTENGTNAATEQMTIERTLDGLKSWTTDPHGAISREEIIYPSTPNGGWIERSIASDDSYQESVYADGLLKEVSSYDSNNVRITKLSYTYDNFNRIQSETTLDGVVKTYAYSADGSVDYQTTRKGEETFTTDYSYNAEGLLDEILLPDGSQKYYRYDDFGRPTKRWGSQQFPVEVEYDVRGRVKVRSSWQEFNPATGDGTAGQSRMTYTYHPQRGFLLSQTDELNRSTNFTYTDSGRTKTRSLHRGVVSTFDYNTAGQVELVDYSDDTPDVGFTYDRLGRVNFVSGGIATSGVILPEDQTYSYDYAYNSEFDLDTETIQTGINRVLKRRYQTAAEGVAGRYIGFDLGTVATPDETSWKRLDYDDAGRLSGIRSSEGDFSYNYELQTSFLKSLTGPVHQVNYAYHPIHRSRSGVTNLVNAEIVSSVDLVFDSLGKIESMSRSGTAITEATYDVLDYDAKGQLTSYDRFSGNDPPSQTEPVHNRSYQFNYDDIGNRTLWQLGPDAPGAPLSDLTFQPNSLNQIDTIIGGGSESIIHDVDGNQLEDGIYLYTWDAENRLTSITPKLPQEGDAKLVFTYDYRNRRLTKTVNEWDTPSMQFLPAYGHEYLYDGWDLIYEKITQQGDTLSTEKTYAWGLDSSQSLGGLGGAGGLLASKTAAPSVSSQSRYYLYDTNANVSEIIDGSGAVVAHYEYSPFGQLVEVFEDPGEELNAYRFSGYYTDIETGLTNYGLRLYNPRLGVWLNRDPSGFTGGENLYAFLNNDPVGSVDRLGLDDYGKQDFSDQISGAWNQEIDTYSNYSTAEWAGWASQQYAGFQIGMLTGALKGVGDTVGFIGDAVVYGGKGIGVGAAYAANVDGVRDYVNGEVSKVFGVITSQIEEISQCLTTDCCRKDMLAELGPEGADYLSKFMRDPGKVLGELIGRVGFDVALTYFTGGLASAKILPYLSKAIGVVKKTLKASKQAIKNLKKPFSKLERNGKKPSPHGTPPPLPDATNKVRPDLPNGYHYRTLGDNVQVVRNPGQAGNLPQMHLDGDALKLGPSPSVPRSSATKAAFLRNQAANNPNIPKALKPYLGAGKVPPGYAVHHKQALFDGGTDTIDNMVLQAVDLHKTTHKFYRPGGQVPTINSPSPSSGY